MTNKKVMNPNLSVKDSKLTPKNFNDVLDIGIRQLKFRNGMTMKRLLFWCVDILDELEENKQVDEKKLKEFYQTKKQIEDLCSK